MATPEEVAKTHPEIRHTKLGAVIRELSKEQSTPGALARVLMESHHSEDLDLMPLHLLRDYMQENEDHPLSKQFNGWLQVPEKLELDRKVRRIVESHGFEPDINHTIYTGLARSLRGEWAFPIIHQVAASLQEKLPGHSPDELIESARRNHIRVLRYNDSKWSQAPHVQEPHRTDLWNRSTGGEPVYDDVDYTPEQFAKSSEWVSAKIKKLLKEGKSRKQAVAIALSMAERESTAEQFQAEKLSTAAIVLPEVIAQPLRLLAAAVRADELADKGIEGWQHITVRYGLHTQDPDDLRPLLAKWEKPIHYELGPVGVFKGPDYDVLKVEVKSPDLQKLHRLLGKLPNTKTHPRYRPHATIAYVKKGHGKKYADQFNEVFSPAPFKGVADSVIFSDSNRQQTPIQLVPASEQPEQFGKQEEEQSFHNAIHTNPADKTSQLVYADWLEENGHSAKAKFIRDTLASNHPFFGTPQVVRNTATDLSGNWQSNWFRDGPHHRVSITAPIKIDLPEGKAVDHMVTWWQTLPKEQVLPTMAALSKEGVVPSPIHEWLVQKYVKEHPEQFRKEPDSFHDRILSDPSNPTHSLDYADWLHSQGKPHHAEVLRLAANHPDETVRGADVLSEEAGGSSLPSTAAFVKYKNGSALHLHLRTEGDSSLHWQTGLLDDSEAFRLAEGLKKEGLPVTQRTRLINFDQSRQDTAAHFAALRAPAGGAIVQGLFYGGGQVLPNTLPEQFRKRVAPRWKRIRKTLKWSYIGDSNLS